MGNSISSQNYWVDDRDKLELDSDSKKLSYYILEIPKTKESINKIKNKFEKGFI
jgi:hypothetical protein